MQRTYFRGEEKVHSVRYEEEGARQDHVCSTLYISKKSGLTSAKRLKVTFEEMKNEVDR